jgi:hypothetical protein
MLHRGPERLARIHRRAVAHHADRTLAGAERHADRSGQAPAKATAGHGKIAPRPVDRQITLNRGAVRRRFLDEDRIVWTGLCKGLDRVVDRNRGGPLNLGGRLARGALRRGLDVFRQKLQQCLHRQVHGTQEAGRARGMCRFGRILGDLVDRHPRGKKRCLAWNVERKDRRADDNDEVIRLQLLRQAVGDGRQEAGKARVILGEVGAAGHRRLPNGGAAAFGELDREIEGSVAIDGRSHHQRQVLRPQHLRGQLRKRVRIGDRTRHALRVVGQRRHHLPVLGRDRDEDWPARMLHGDLVSLRDGQRHILGSRRLNGPFYVGTRKLRRAVGAKIGRVQQHTALLLTCRDHQRRMVAIGGEQIAQSVAHPGGRMQVHKRRVARRLRIAIGHRQRARLLEGKYVSEIPREVGQEVELGRAGIAEHRRHAA